MLRVFLPSIVCLAVPLIYLSLRLKGNMLKPATKATEKGHVLSQNNQLIVLIG